MYRRFYNQYEEQAQEIMLQTPPPATEEHTMAEHKAGEHKSHVQERHDFLPQFFPSDFLKNIKLDDIILIGLILVLMSEEKKDITLLLALGFLFISGM